MGAPDFAYSVIAGRHDVDGALGFRMFGANDDDSAEKLALAFINLYYHSPDFDWARLVCISKDGERVIRSWVREGDECWVEEERTP